MSTRKAGCSCGRLTAVCTGEPALVAICHCAACQRRTGSAFGVAAFFPRPSVATSGPARSFARQSDSGYRVTFHFCPDCGSTVYWEPARKPDMIAVAVGAFVDPDFPAPSKEAHSESRHPWVSCNLS